MTNLQKNMRRNGLITAAIGAFFALSVLPALHPAAWLFLQLAYWPMADIPTGMQAPVGVLLAISGGLTVGIGMAVWALGTHVAGRMPLEAGQVVRIMTWSWFTVDSAFSILSGAPFNAALNLIFLALLLMAVRGAGATSAAPAQA